MITEHGHHYWDSSLSIPALWPGTCHFPSLCFRSLICKQSNNSLNPVSFLWGWYRIMYSKGLEEGFTNINNQQRKSRLFVPFLKKEKNIRNIPEWFWNVRSISLAIFLFQQHNFFVDYHFSFLDWNQILVLMMLQMDWGSNRAGMGMWALSLAQISPYGAALCPFLLSSFTAATLWVYC